MKKTRGLIVGAGDFFGPTAENTWFSFLATNAAGTGALLLPEKRNIPHTWAYLSDLAATVAQLLRREADLGDLEVFHFKGHEASAREFISVCSDALGGRKVKPVPWSILKLAGLFSANLGKSWRCAICGKKHYAWTNKK